MNALEKAHSLEITSKITTAVHLFKAQFPDARADLRPWRNDPDTRNSVDPYSIDIAFHLPGWSPRYQSRSMLVQIRFHPDPSDQTQRLIGIETIGINHQGLAWRLSTVESWQVVGPALPAPDIREKLRHFTRQAFELFQSGPSLQAS
ncbi:hypothetical protein [Synechocystis sp. LKSZ1]|uniref:hypothetical protein n=1 Tax=Synechocystis sp. LKSZ1 TaxID=3144951 RepID=UPI00336BE4B2